MGFKGPTWTRADSKEVADTLCEDLGIRLPLLQAGVNTTWGEAEQREEDSTRELRGCRRKSTAEDPQSWGGG